MKLDELNDEKLVELAQTDLNCFGLIVEKHYQRLYTLAFKWTYKREDAEDVVQEAFLKAYRRFKAQVETGQHPDVEPSASENPKNRSTTKSRRPKRTSILNLKSWLTTVLWSAFMDFCREKKKAPPLILLGDEEFSELLELLEDTLADQPGLVAEAHMIYEIIIQEIAALSEKYRSIAHLYFIEGLSAPEIAKQLEMPLETVKTRITRARNILRDCLKKRLEFGEITL